MDLLVTFIACLITGLACNFIFHYKSKDGEMDVTWNEEDCMWDAKLHIPAGVDYSEVDKIIVKVNHL